MNMAAFQDAARHYAAAGIVPLPIARDGKKPLVKHPDKFGRRAALQLALQFPDANLGFWCGPFNRLTVADIDSTSDSELRYVLDTFGDSPVIVRTASGKHHAYYRHAGERRRIRRLRGHAIDILGTGLCVAPPSVRPSGGRYKFVRGGLADLANLPPMRAGVLDQLERADVEAITPPRQREGVEVITECRNIALFGLARELALTTETHDELLAKVRAANAALASPPLPENEVVGSVRMAWRYKTEGRLMVRGMGSAILIPSKSIDRLVTAGEADVLTLLTMIRRAHGSRPKPFALSPLAMAQARKIGTWGRNRYRAAIRKACDMGELEQVTAGGKGKHDPALYRLKHGFESRRERQ
jgi:hypothetical protein